MRTDIGGQAVIEGVMMKGKNYYSVAVRKLDNSISIDTKKSSSLLNKHAIFRSPIIRGMIVFAESLIVGTKTLTYSADVFGEGDEEEESKFELWLRNKFGKKGEQFLMGMTLAFSFALSIVIFMLLPMWLSQIFRPWIPSSFALNLIEGAIRITIFLIYMKLVANMKDIKRTFEYHGAEHKTINCLEQDKELTVENVKTCTRLHKSCGTSFLFIVMVVSILVFSVFTTKNIWLRTIVRIIMVPVISGISYELIRWARKNPDSKLANLVSIPGMWLQKEFTTLEPDDAQIEVAIAAIQAVIEKEDAANANS
ncbi:DUF1385 domain-containing protein [Candidatus Epulonipiscium viviparus]|uniref:DUF1385 domain-containing protein n=1 Tax=Candidatus Epulonipiscium viviparus TaxID=420336 RepID=UPI00016C046C|nr:DUF1385 domain-containing protein [Candidatus Epulopiscium viviparus]